MYRVFKKRTSAFILSTVIFLFGACSNPDKSKEIIKKRKFSVPVQVGKVVYKDVEDQVRTIGVLVEEKSIVIASEVKGRVIAVYSEEGMKVKTNDVLATIDPTDYQLKTEKLSHKVDAAIKELEKAQSGERPEEKEQLVANEQAAQSKLDLSIKSHARIKALVDNGIMAQSTLDKAIDELKRSEAQLKAKQASRQAGLQAREEDIEKLKSQLVGISAQYDQALLNLTKTSIRAPFDGIVIKKSIDKGEFAGPATPIIQLSMTPSLIARMNLPQSYRNKLSGLKRMEINFKEINTKVILDKNHCKRVHVIPVANIYSGNFDFWIDLPGKNGENLKLFAGLTFEAKLFLGKRKNILHVPSVALVISEEGTVVYIIKNGKAHLVPVLASKERNGFVEIQDLTNQLGPKVDIILRGSGSVFPNVEVHAANTLTN